jgi:hypothetical protein
MAWGVLRTHVLLPHGAAAWPVEKRSAVLYHEIAHLVRLDPLTQTVARLACALFWFNPLLWTAMSRLVAEQDKACDDLAAARFGNAPDYAEQVLEVVNLTWWAHQDSLLRQGYGGQANPGPTDYESARGLRGCWGSAGVLSNWCPLRCVLFVLDVTSWTPTGAAERSYDGPTTLIWPPELCRGVALYRTTPPR